jgi:hypothetical protein
VEKCAFDILFTSEQGASSFMRDILSSHSPASCHVVLLLSLLKHQSITVHSPTNALFIKLGKVFKIYIKIQTKYRSYKFRSSTIIRELVLNLAKVMLEHSVICRYMLCGGVAACLGVAYVLCVVQNETEWRVCCVLCAVQNETEWRVCCVLCRMRLSGVCVVCCAEWD